MNSETKKIDVAGSGDEPQCKCSSEIEAIKKRLSQIEGRLQRLEDRATPPGQLRPRHRPSP